MRKILFCLFIFLYMSTLYAENTRLAWYRPFGSDAIKIIKENTGNCLEQSKIIIREDAWRCEAEGQILDPCFVNHLSNKKLAVCLQSPWTNSAIKLQLETEVDNTKHQLLDMSKTYPWGIELINGERCLAIITSESYDNLPIRYQCLSDNILLGHIQRCDPSWKILMLKNKQFITAIIAKVWF